MGTPLRPFASRDWSRSWINLKDVLWALHFFPVRALVRRCPEAWLPAIESAVERVYRGVRIPQRRLVAKRMRETLGISAGDANELARRFQTSVAARAHFDVRVVSGRATIFPEGSTIAGREHLHEGLAAGTGVVLITVHRFAAHQGLLALRDLGYSILTVRGEKVAAAYGRLGRLLARRVHPQVLDRTFPDRVGPHDPELALKLLGRLRSGGMVCMTADTQRAKHAVVVPFLGSALRVNPGVFDVVRLSGCQLIPLDMLYDFDDVNGGPRLRIEFGAPLACRTTGPKDECARENLALLVQTLEQIVRRRPEQWTKWIDT